MLLGTIGEGKCRVVTEGKCDMIVTGTSEWEVRVGVEIIGVWWLDTMSPTGTGFDISDWVLVLLGVKTVETIGRCLKLPNGEIMFPSQSLAVAILNGKRTAHATS